MTDTGARPWLHRCSVCDEKMGTEEVIVVNKNVDILFIPDDIHLLQVYHARHFKCYACQQEIAITDQFHLLEKERAVCISCFASTFAPVCSGNTVVHLPSLLNALGCHRGIVDNCVRASGQHFHRKCFNCTR